MPKYRTVTCDSCEVLVINNIICHETGCPMPGKTRPEYASGAGTASSRKRRIRSFAIPLARNHITAKKQKEK